MTIGFQIDATDFAKVGREFTTAARKDLLDEVQQSVSKAANNVKSGMREDFTDSKHFRKVGQGITYDLERRADYVEAEVGPVKSGAGNLANIAYFGGAHGGGGSIRDPEVHLQDEAPRLEGFLSDIVDRWLE